MFCSLKQLCVCDFANLADLAAEPSALKLFFCRRGTHVCLWNKQCHLPQTFLLKYWSLVQRMGKGGSHPAAPRFFFSLLANNLVRELPLLSNFWQIKRNDHDTCDDAGGFGSPFLANHGLPFAFPRPYPCAPGKKKKYVPSHSPLSTLPLAAD